MTELVAIEEIEAVRIGGMIPISRLIGAVVGRLMTVTATSIATATTGSNAHQI